MAIAQVVPSIKPKGQQYTAFVQVEHPRDDSQGQHLFEYFLTYDYTYADIPTGGTAGGISGGIGSKVSFPALPAHARVIDVLHETLTGFISTGVAPDIDGIFVGDTGVILDADVTATGVKMVVASLPGSTSGLQALSYVPLQAFGSVQPVVYFACAVATGYYYKGAGRLYVKVISFDEA